MYKGTAISVDFNTLKKSLFCKNLTELDVEKAQKIVYMTTVIVVRK
ncbi:hypothetical protein F3K44_33105 [Bacillus megaterium]|nr:hypothetical protein [Priestia megaterium]NGY94067.1 hypothetical protein [Priestia megaterium]